MRTTSILVNSLLSLLLAVSIVGCDDDGGSSSPVGANIAGAWSGTYYREGGGGREEITAKVGQDGNAVSISTSKSSPTGRRLTGTITPDGDLTMTDADDGEVWSNFGRVTDTYIRIGDYTRHPTARDDPGSVPLYIIELTR